LSVADPAARVASFLDPHHSDPNHRDQLDAWLQLQAALAFEPELARACLVEFEDPRDALAHSGASPRLGKRALADIRRAMIQHGVRALPLLSPDYPAPLFALSDPSPLLLVRGEVGLLSGTLVAIVGARAASVYGLDLAGRLAARLAQVGVTVVSGLARGIDAAAHRAALAAGGTTIAVQACGPERVYPAEHRDLAARIAERGAVISEMPFGTPPRGTYFPLRNRLISGLSRCVVVVEARERSGSLITVRHALDQGRDVMAVPGPVTAPTSQGPNRLIRDGAVPILECDDVLEALGIEVGVDSQSGQPASEDDPGEGGRAILEALARGALSRDDLGRLVAASAAQVDLELLKLQLGGRIQRDRDGRMVIVGNAPRGAKKT